MKGQWVFPAWLRKLIALLIVDVLMEFYARTKNDPVFVKKFQGAFDSLNSATTPEENNAAAKAIQDLVSS